jgi:HD-like signal output (HDOD) protein
VDRTVDLNLFRGLYRRGISPVPQLALVQALQLAGDENSNSELLSEHIESDRRLRTCFLASVNLPMFCGRNSIKSVRQGVGELGRRKIVSLLWLTALSDFQLFRNQRGDWIQLANGIQLENRGRNRLWRHALLTGVLAQQLVHAAGLDNAGDALTAGLAHDIGHYLLGYRLPQLGIASHEDPVNDDCGHDEHDRLLEDDLSPAPELDHCQLGASLLDLWDAPRELVASARHHHNPEATEAAFRPLIAGVRLADLLAEHLDLGRPNRPLRLEAAPVWRELATLEPWNQVFNVHAVALKLLPESLVTAEHLVRVLGGQHS